MPGDDCLLSTCLFFFFAPSTITVLLQSGSQPQDMHRVLYSGRYSDTLYLCAATVSATITFMCDQSCLLPNPSQGTRRSRITM